ncbi:hypothetical protein ERO13_D02G199150v2 [Gossypium hirsutum]|uniref:RNase H type-1 domain-containing protein n=3 Tax=Gossypium TaxID=3633 RepID=A0A5J5SG57_GOSBA|nr:hypothetical protein ES319_D02G229200v1 [Gossypium barbadense]KAG4159862.1 hypothetical protein ERO13_D02G199150v2 [Gossypium hirsutum]TYG80807.1 hypothetical protein ES288_D02G245600v1 [Gossypium darwinii]TYH85202.1 hypothetical protein ES332_D02G248700v1 [Gossypium tomentosum]KAG4159863.1 hypothetical protein ERO13_D02G199150v2 [Gossypium hirsutum]
MHVEYGICWWWPRVSTQHLGPKWNPESSSDVVIRTIHQILQRGWIVCLEHVYREANDVADPLSNNAKTRELGYHFFNEPPEKS